MSKKKLVDKWVYFKFYDHHASDEIIPAHEILRNETIIELCGYVIAEQKILFFVETEKVSLLGNSRVWGILKSAVIETKILF